MAGYKEDPVIRCMRVRAWFNAVTRASGKTAAALEREFTERQPADKTKEMRSSPSRVARAQLFNGQIVASYEVPGREATSDGPYRSCLWQRYRQGLVVPSSGPRPKGTGHMVQRVEQRYPGTAKWLTSPLWRAADRAPLAMADVRRAYAALPPYLRSVFIEDGDDESSVFWRRPVDFEDACDLLFRDRSVDAFAAVLVMVKEAETIQNQDQHQFLLALAATYFTLLADDPVVGDLLQGELDVYLSARWRAVRYRDLPLDDELEVAEHAM